MMSDSMTTSIKSPLTRQPGFIAFLLLVLCSPCSAEEVPRANQSANQSTNQSANQSANQTIGYDLSPVFTRDETYDAECSSCHIAYPPFLLPKKSWQKLMSGLDDHFGESADLDAVTSTYILNYLNCNSLESESGSVVSHWQKVINDDPPIRITELSIFVDDHEGAYELLGESAEDPGFFAPCRDCHKEAEDGIFGKDRLFRGARGVFRRFSNSELESEQ
jgi:hypothetical protein